MLKKILIKKTDNLFIQFFRYFFVGGFAFIIDFGILYTLTFFDFFKKYYLFAATISFICGLITNYIISIIWVFNKSNYKNKLFEFIIFGIIGVVGLFLNSFFIWIFTEYLFAILIKINNIQHRIILSKILSTFFVFNWNFFARKFLIFK